MYNVSSIGPNSINPYSKITKKSNVQSVNPFFQEDSFSISDDAMILSAALNEAKASLNSEMSKLDMDKINALKQQIAAGEYSVTGKDVAEKLLSQRGE